MDFSNSYAALGKNFHEKNAPVPVKEPTLFLWNSSLAEQLRVPDVLSKDSVTLAKVFSGNQLLPGSESIATAYAGHQFGHFVPQLGDGRAHLLGDVCDQSGHKWDIQLKGSGPTAFSRGGDGRCAIGPAVREFIMSEAMHALGVPTTRCLAVVTTGELVFRENTAQPGAIVTRVASSHIRIGTFQFFSSRGDSQALKELCDYTIERHYPKLNGITGKDRYISLLESFSARLIQLVVEWMRVGFIHGVMNTDNMALSGETIDYGPCAMMGVYDPQTVYSSIDHYGRYSFGNQPAIAQWNLARFAECLLPLVDPDTDSALEQLKPVVTDFLEEFDLAYLKMMAQKIGLDSLRAGDDALIQLMLDGMLEKNMDYTLTFERLRQSLSSKQVASQIKLELGSSFFEQWQSRLKLQNIDHEQVQEVMQKYNPLVIPRNHYVEAAIKASEQTGDNTQVEQLLDVLSSPYKARPHTKDYQDLPSDGDVSYQTFCGT